MLASVSLEHESRVPRLVSRAEVIKFATNSTPRIRWSFLRSHDIMLNLPWARKTPPPIRTLEEQRARESKGLASSKRHTRQGVSCHRRQKQSQAPPTATSSDTAIGVNFHRPDDEYDGPTTTEATLTADRRQRTGIKRKRYAEDADETNDSSCGELETSSASVTMSVVEVEISAQNTERVRLAEHQTVIVGAGVVGLFIARELALEARSSNRKSHITVVEIRPSYCELASGHCNGFLTTSGVPNQWAALIKPALESWQTILSDPDARQRLRFSRDTLFSITDTGGVNADKSPSWLQGCTDPSLLEDFSALGRL